MKIERVAPHQCQVNYIGLHCPKSGHLVPGPPESKISGIKQQLGVQHRTLNKSKVFL